MKHENVYLDGYARGLRRAATFVRGGDADEGGIVCRQCMAVMIEAEADLTEKAKSYHQRKKTGRKRARQK